MGVKIVAQDKRDVGRAIWNGMKLKCPHCGEGHMFRGYLKVADSCDACGEELKHHRADDGPPYIAIMIVGHLLVGIMLHMEIAMQVNPLTYLYTMLPLAVILPLAMLPSIKGGLVGLQWANRMHGFDPNRPREIPEV
ncbi:Uncharacterized conserved protein, DUF983 family [Devosia enhydra]|uniref:Uncharacterized conserved protein, DUF983 family n=1 Tax=Devosia enhydra TaxID=665118 RepID=A0A1K2HUL1_9HYPH|nr:DUF983 domain-containing protein [Devosia enhydra]SFZ81959.1 Uncharacterized conserved protein, DUF983 family [Devosia enhydra]